MDNSQQQRSLPDPRVHVDLDGLRRIGLQGRNIRLLPRQPVSSILNGRHASRLRGRGLNFEELRNYQPGDDIRSIDWKVTARTGTPHVRVYSEERDRPALLLVDQRQAMFFGSRVYMKSVVAAEAAALAAHRVLDQGDRLGGIVFGTGRIAEHRPVRNQKGLMRLLSSIVTANNALHASASVDSEQSLNEILLQALRIARKGALIAIFSDFDGMNSETEPLVRALAHSNDLIAFNVADPLAAEMPDNLRLSVSDGVLQAEIDFTDSTVRKNLETLFTGRLARLFEYAQRYGFPVLPLNTVDPALDQIQRLLGHRPVAQ